jgi:hypothetical protein
MFYQVPSPTSLSIIYNYFKVLPVSTLKRSRIRKKGSGFLCQTLRISLEVVIKHLKLICSEFYIRNIYRCFVTVLFWNGPDPFLRIPDLFKVVMGTLNWFGASCGLFQRTLESLNCLVYRVFGPLVIVHLKLNNFRPSAN